MPSNEPRVNPPAGEKTSSAAPGSGSGNGGGPNGSGHGAVKTVTVAASVENALFAVQQQLEREAEKVRLVPVAAAPAPVALAPGPAPALRVREVTPVIVEPDYDYADEDDDESEFWGEPRRRATQRKVDPKLLTREERKALGKLRARKVRRIVRHVSPWSIFKFSIFFYLCVWLILMVAGVILWKLSQTAGVVTNFEKFYAKAAGEKAFEIDGRSLFRAGATAGAILVFAATGFTVLMAVLFNLITDLTGGIRLTVIELESTRRTVRRRAGSERLRARARLSDEELASAERAGRRRPRPVDTGKAATATKPAATTGSAPPTTRVNELLPEPRRRPAPKADAADPGAKAGAAASAEAN